MKCDSARIGGMLVRAEAKKKEGKTAVLAWADALDMKRCWRLSGRVRLGNPPARGRPAEQEKTWKQHLAENKCLARTSPSARGARSGEDALCGAVNSRLLPVARDLAQSNRVLCIAESMPRDEPRQAQMFQNIPR
jgi:hypothetical protein